MDINSTANGRRTVHGIKSEQTADGIVWHVMEGWKDNASSFATWTHRLSTHSDHNDARSAYREAKAL